MTNENEYEVERERKREMLRNNVEIVHVSDKQSALQQHQQIMFILSYVNWEREHFACFPN